MAGSVGGAAQVLVGHPLDTIKATSCKDFTIVDSFAQVKLQSQVGGRQFSGGWDAIKKVIQQVCLG